MFVIHGSDTIVTSKHEQIKAVNGYIRTLPALAPIMHAIVQYYFYYQVPAVSSINYILVLELYELYMLLENILNVWNQQKPY